MPGKLIATRGLPGSGKTTWALAQVAAADPGTVVRVNRDDLRAMLFGLSYSTPIRGCEEQVSAVQRAAVERGLRNGQTVIVDDTGLRVKYLREWARLAAKVGATFEVQDFTDVDLDTCINRDSWRALHGGRHVGDDVIRGMHQRFLAGARPINLVALAEESAPVTGKPYTGTPGAPRAVIVDIDGTVALHGERNPYDTSRYHEDGPNEPVIEMIRLLDREGYEVLFTSGRDAGFRQVTREWIDQHVFPYDARFELFMRPEGDTRNDAVVKLELFDEHIRDHYDVVWVFDDRNRVVEAWRSIGLPVLQVAPGDF